MFDFANTKTSTKGHFHFNNDEEKENHDDEFHGDSEDGDGSSSDDSSDEEEAERNRPVFVNELGYVAADERLVLGLQKLARRHLNRKAWLREQEDERVRLRWWRRQREREEEEQKDAGADAAAVSGEESSSADRATGEREKQKKSGAAVAIVVVAAQNALRVGRAVGRLPRSLSRAPGQWRRWQRRTLEAASLSMPTGGDSRWKRAVAGVVRPSEVEEWDDVVERWKRNECRKEETPRTG